MSAIGVALFIALASLDPGIVVLEDTDGLDGQEQAAVEQLADDLGGQIATIDAGFTRLLAVSRDSSVVQAGPPGFGFPMATAAVAPSEVLGLFGGEVSARLELGEVVMSQRSAMLRGADVGDVLTIETWDGDVVEVALGAILPDERLGWFEIIAPRPLLGRGLTDHVALWDLDRGLAKGLIEVVFGGRSVEIRETFFSGLPVIVLKETFGEFAVDAAFAIDEAWIDVNIVEVNIPRLGSLRCHRAVVPYLQNAVAELVDMRIGWMIHREDTEQFGGCFEEDLGVVGTRSLTPHAWGAALSINPSSNPPGEPARLNSRLAEVIAGWGFRWDTSISGGYFEWRGFDFGHHRCADMAVALSADRWILSQVSGSCP